MRAKNLGRLLPIIPLVLGIAFVGCTDEEIVFRDRPVFDDPTPGAGDFVGYTLTGAEPGANNPSCSNCHVGPSSEWKGSAHADAWAGLVDSGHAQEFCAGCHTVSEFGNEISQPSGYTSTQDTVRYADVQCESCHGPGLPHVAAPDNSGPLASMLSASTSNNGCAECHSGTHHPYVEQWELSGHGGVTGSAANRAGCASCHSGNGALDAWGITANYLEKASVGVGTGNYLDITCAVCHDPHGGPYAGQLRFPVEFAPGTADLERELCSQCHDRRSVPDPGSSHGLHPHSPHKAMLLGEAGFFFPGMEIDVGDIVGSHGEEGNPRLCAGCHVDSWTVTNAETGDFEFEAVGHTFAAIACVDANGQPTGETECDLSTSDRYFASCATSGCHGGEQSAFSALVSAAQSLRFLANELHELIEAAPEGCIDTGDGVISTCEGAEFNLYLAEFGEGREGLLPYTSAAAHNPFLARSLLVASIEAMRDEYGLSPSASYEAFVNDNPELMPRYIAQ